MRTIALEEHYLSRAALKLGFEVPEAAAEWLPTAQLLDLGARRIKDMDEGGIDVQILGHTHFGNARPSPEVQVPLARAANDEAAAAVSDHPGRFAAFALLPMGDPQAAVTELRRAVSELGFKGAMVNGRTDGRFLDDSSLFPILETAAQLGVPLYLHPGMPSQVILDEYYADLPPKVAFTLSTVGWGWHQETGLHALRMISTGVFDRLPELQLIIGHMGEMIPVMLDRIEDWVSRGVGLQRTVAETFGSNFYVTTSGFFTAPPLNLLLQVVGADRVLFSVDYPYSSNSDGQQFLDRLQISPADKEKISHLNAERLFRLPAA